jgi:hypothetical protein
MGCASSSGDPAADDTAPVPTTSKQQKTPPSDPNAHPAFEAGFPDANNGDPTPDGGDTCIDRNNAGSTENTAKALPDTTDAQHTPIEVKGVLTSAVDVDFYSIKVKDTLFHILTADLKDGTASTEMCVFMRCASGTTNFKGCTDGVEKTSDIGDKGCCTGGPGKANPNWSCGGFLQTDDSAQVYVRIKETAGAGACLPYSWSYAF